jgi:hypothetical protein
MKKWLEKEPLLHLIKTSPIKSNNCYAFNHSFFPVSNMPLPYSVMQKCLFIALLLGHLSLRVQAQETATTRTRDLIIHGTTG